MFVQFQVCFRVAWASLLLASQEKYFADKSRWLIIKTYCSLCTRENIPWHQWDVKWWKLSIWHLSHALRMVNNPPQARLCVEGEGGSLGDKFYTSHKHIPSACFRLIHACSLQAPMSHRIHRIDRLDAGNYTVDCLDASNRGACDNSCMHYTHNSVCLSCIRW